MKHGIEVDFGVLAHDYMCEVLNLSLAMYNKITLARIQIVNIKNTPNV